METGTLTNKTFSSSQVILWEYLLVAHPDASVNARVMAEKESFSAQYKVPVAIKTKPNITVANFLAKEEMEETIIRWMHRIISMQKSFTITLDQFSGFKPHTIYLRVQDHQPFQQLAKELKVVDEYVKSYGCPEMHLNKFPHLTIARRLPGSTYEQAIADYSIKSFHASFEVKDLVLLRRQHPFDSCKQVNVFGLTP